MSKYISIDVGGTGIKYALMDQSAALLDQGEYPTPKEGLDAFLDLITSIYDQYKTENPEALVMAAPGRIDSVNGYFYTGGALMYLNGGVNGYFYTGGALMYLNGGVDLKGLLKDRIPIPFYVENDAKAAAMAELWKGAMQDVNSGLVLTIGTGIGGAVIINGKLWKGNTFAAGEFSPIPTNWNGRAMANHQAWSDINCTNAMVRRHAMATGQNPAEANGRTFFEAVSNGDPKAIEELEWFCETLATGLYGLQCALDVEKVAIGGGISRQPILIDTLDRVMSRQYDRLPVWFPASKPAVAACHFSSDANLIGALYNYLDQTNQL